VRRVEMRGEEERGEEGKEGRVEGRRGNWSPYFSERGCAPD